MPQSKGGTWRDASSHRSPIGNQRRVYGVHIAAFTLRTTSRLDFDFAARQVDLQKSIVVNALTHSNMTQYR